MELITPPSEVEILRKRIVELESALANVVRSDRSVFTRRTGKLIDTTQATLLAESVPAVPEDRSPIQWSGDDQRALADAFHRMWYDHRSSTWEDTHWLGHQLLKLPLDLWVYQELIWKVRPTVFIECGTNRGGSALYFASLFDLIGTGRVISLDVERHGNPPVHPRIEYLLGSSTSEEIISAVRDQITPDDVVMVFLDSDHTASHVRGELEAFAPMVTSGSYVIVEDSNINGHPVLPNWGPGPWEALVDFFEGSEDFERDPWCERYLMSFATDGFWRRR